MKNSRIVLAAALMTVGFVAPSFAAAPAPTPAPTPFVLALQGIEGESMQKGHEKNIDVTPAPSVPVCITVLGATLCIASK
jgi:hypothetical protein